MDWAKTTARRDEKHFSIWCGLYYRFDSNEGGTDGRVDKTDSLRRRKRLTNQWHIHRNINQWHIHRNMCEKTFTNTSAMIFLIYITTQISRFMGPIWVLSAPDGPHVGPMNLAVNTDDALMSNISESNGRGSLVNISILTHLFFLIQVFISFSVDIVGKHNSPTPRLKIKKAFLIWGFPL